MEFSQQLPDGGTFYSVGLDDYLKAIQNSPPNTLIFVGDPIPQTMVRCLRCSSEMDECLKEAHRC